MNRGLCFILLLILCIFGIACTESGPLQVELNPEPYIWYGKIKDFILAESNLPEDSVQILHGRRKGVNGVKSFKKGILTIERWYNENGKTVGEIYFSHDGQFELRREICDNGVVAFEGVFYKQNAYGPSTWKDCFGNIKEAGIRFNNEKVGEWISFNNHGGKHTINYKNYNLIDSLQTIKPLKSK